MNKFIAILALICLTVPVFADRSNTIKISQMSGPVLIKTPNGESETYKKIEDITQIQYGSKIYATKKTATLQLFNNTDVIIDKKQGVLITKNPITNELILFKTEGKGNDKIRINLIDGTTATFGANTRIVIKEQYPYVILNVVKGSVVIRTEEFDFYDINEGEYYEAKCLVN